MGPNLLAFRFAPVAMGLIINGLCFVNISCDYFLARRLGFPYLHKPLISLRSGSTGDYGELAPGLRRVMRPVFQGSLVLSGAEYFQPMFPTELNWPCRPLYENDYVKAHCLEWASGVGGIFHSRGDRFHWLGIDGIERAAEPCRIGAEKKVMLSVISALKQLNTRGSPDYSYRTPEDRRLIDARINASLKELRVFEQVIRSSPNAPWVQGKSA